MTRLQDVDRFKSASTKEVLRKARQVCEEEHALSCLFDADALKAQPRFDNNEVVVGKVVGRGGFCVVRQLVSVKLKGFKQRSFDSKSSRSKRHSPSHSLTSSSNSSIPSTAIASSSSSTVPETSIDLSSREFLARRVWSKGSKYVVKEVEGSLIESDRCTYLRGLVDLVLEASFLSSLSHPNILSLRATSSGDPFDKPGYFLVLDELKDTLPKRLNTWMQIKRTTSGITGFVTRGKRKASSLMIERLLVAYDVAEAMCYLHGCNVVYRDLKPDNVGFDGEDTLKLFDFGLAKELRPEYACENGLYLLTGCTGGIRYMAPEIGLNEPYNQFADVYSWAMLLWHIIALEPPMGMYTPSMFMDRVFQLGYRPAVKDKWPHGLNRLMKTCWSREICERPDFKAILRSLRDEALSLEPSLNDFFAGDQASRTSSARSAFLSAANA